MVIKVLIADQRVDPSDLNNLAIRWTSEKGHLEVAKLLLADPRVDPSAMNNEAILKASQKGHVEVVMLLLGSDKINQNIKTEIQKELQLKMATLSVACSYSKLSHNNYAIQHSSLEGYIYFAEYNNS